MDVGQTSCASSAGPARRVSRRPLGRRECQPSLPAANELCGRRSADCGRAAAAAKLERLGRLHANHPDGSSSAARVMRFCENVRRAGLRNSGAVQDGRWPSQPAGALGWGRQVGDLYHRRLHSCFAGAACRPAIQSGARNCAAAAATAGAPSAAPSAPARETSVKIAPERARRAVKLLLT